MHGRCPPCRGKAQVPTTSGCGPAVGHLAWDQVVGSSNLSTPTKPQHAGDASSSLAGRSSTLTVYLFIAIVGLWRNRERACLASRGPGFDSQLVHQYAPVAQRI